MGDFGIKYNPNITVNNYTLKNKVSESTILVDAPLEKQFGEAMAIKVEARAESYHLQPQSFKQQCKTE